MQFCLLGATQLQNAAKLIHRMDQKHSLLDQFLVAMPLALRPTREQLDQTCRRVNEVALSDFKPPFDSIFDAHTNIKVYQLDDETAQVHWDLQCDFAAEVRKFRITTWLQSPRKQTLFPGLQFVCPCFPTSLCRNYTLTHPIQKCLSTSSPQFFQCHRQISRTL